jgi:uncharacterized membrane protein
MIYQKGLIGLALALLLGVAVVPSQAAELVSPRPEQQHYWADETPPGLTRNGWQQIVNLLQQQAYQVAPAASGIYQATNPAQDWQLEFGAAGVTVRSQTNGWEWGLHLQQAGRAGALLPLGQPDLSTAGQTVTYNWGAGLRELDHNRAEGLKQDFILNRRPGGRGLVRLELAVRGNLTGRLAGEQVNFHDGQGRLVLSYSGLVVVDANGQALKAWFELADHRLSIVLSDAGALYPVTIDPLAQQAYLKASNTDEFDSFGIAVAVSGDTVVVGAWQEDSSATGINGNQANNSASDAGATYVFTRIGTTWSQQAYLKASNTGADDRFGSAVAISGNTVVVGASGEDSSATGVNGNQVDNSAGSAGAAYVFTRTGTTWSQQAYLKASNTNALDLFGAEIAISGNTVVVGAMNEDSSATGVNGNQADNSAGSAGAAYVFTRIGTTWSQQAYLKASNTGADDRFGVAVAVSGDTVVVGALLEDSSATGINGNQADNSASDAGATYVFTRIGTTWSQQAYLKASNTALGDSFGITVAVSGNTVVVGASGEDSSATGVNGNQSNNSASRAGAAYVFTRIGTTWSQQAYLKASNTALGDSFGIAVAISGNTVVVGASGEDSSATGVNGNQADNSASDAGAAYVFTRTGTTWSQQAYLKASNTGAGDQFYVVAVSGDTVVVGALHEDSSATGVNGNQSNNSASSAGAAYVFGPVVYLPLVLKPAPHTFLYVKSINTGGINPVEIRDPDNGNALLLSCVIGNNVTQFCGSFPPVGTYTLIAHTQNCGKPQGTFHDATLYAVITRQVECN